MTNTTHCHAATIQLVLGDQLVMPTPHLDKAHPVVMIEHNDLCRNYTYHQAKIAFFFSAMRHYKIALEADGYSVLYHRYTPHPPGGFFDTLMTLAPRVTQVRMITCSDPSFESIAKTALHAKGVTLVTGPNPVFLTTLADFGEYLSGVKTPFMKTYYEQARQRTGILMNQGQPDGGKYSFDAMNQKKVPKTLRVPPRCFPAHDAVTLGAIHDVKQYFSDHVGDAKALWLPVTRPQALDWWHDFLNRYFTLFGDYEDAIDTRDDWLFHSGISALLNCGLLTPNEVINMALAQRERVPLNALEGFIRQIMGWREFIRGMHGHYYHDQPMPNFFNHHRALAPCWWTATTGHGPLDDAISQTLRLGYAHHIHRLMVIGATMLMVETYPQHVHDWFMVMTIDSTEWAMAPNVYGMSQFSDGGRFATKPYICGSNYIRKMSHYGTGDWCDVSDGLYWRFIDKHQDFFIKNARMGFAVSTLKKMPADKRTRLMTAANTFIQNVTK
jgi:deoxyribodipyrimidine photolyase-related protein